MRFFGEGRRGALSPVEKPRDAEAMDAGVAVSVDDQATKRRAEAGVKTKSASGTPAGTDKKTDV
jgi:hypothetical protein